MVVVTNASLADGFRLAGADVVVATSGAGAAATLRAVVGLASAGVVLVTDDLWEGIPQRLRGTLENLAQPIVLEVPAGAGFDVGSGRVQIVEMLGRAIGYRIQTPGGEVR